MMRPIILLHAVDLAAAAAELARIAAAYDAAQREGVGVRVVRDPTGRLVSVWVDDDVPAGQIHDMPLSELGVTS